MKGWVCPTGRFPLNKREAPMTAMGRACLMGRFPQCSRKALAKDFNQYLMIIITHDGVALRMYERIFWSKIAVQERAMPAEFIMKIPST